MRKFSLFFIIIMMIPAISQARIGDCWDRGGWGPMMGYGFGGMIMMLMWILFILIVGMVLYALVRGKRITPFGIPPGETALDILKKRYAKGEIKKEEFEQMKRDLQD
jgi:putative membrane protein